MNCNTLQELWDKLAHDAATRGSFNNHLGLTFPVVSSKTCEVHFAKADYHIGNYAMNILHGGVIATVIDVAGGTLALGFVAEKYFNADRGVLAERLNKVSTVDLRVDYLRPGYGEHFKGIATITRGGNKILSADIKFINDSDVLIAKGSAIYLVG